jgi:signal transduction histidine kinase
MSRTEFLNRLLSDEGKWLDATALLAEIAAVYGLDGVGIRWPAEGVSLLSAETTPATNATKQYPLNVPNQAVGVFWTTGSNKTSDSNELQLLANVLSVSPTLQRLLGPFADQERFAQRLEDAAKVAGRVAHDLDNVFQGVMGFTSLASAQVQPGSQVANFLREVQTATDNGLRFCSQLHQLSRAGSAKPFPGSLPNAIAAEVKRLQNNENKVRLETSVPADLPALGIDEGGLRQMFGHLLNNAVEASAPGNVVQVQARKRELTGEDLSQWLGRPAPGPNVEVVVRDHGVGMDAAAQRRVFVEPFFTTKFRHRGLSLATVFRMLSAHRGGVRVESVVGRGTEITVVLPLALPMFRSTDSRSTGGSS